MILGPAIFNSVQLGPHGFTIYNHRERYFELKLKEVSVIVSYYTRGGGLENIIFPGSVFDVISDNKNL